MPVEHVPLLHIQFDLQQMPRDMTRFQAYLETLTNDDRSDVRYMPLVGMNPMGREHVTERVQAYLALDADAIAAEAVASVDREFGGFGQSLQHGLVVMDDVRGGWTNRTNNDFALRFTLEFPLKRPWLTTPLWVSEPASAAAVQRAVRATIRRAFSIVARGRRAHTLGEMLAQEGEVLAYAGYTPTLDADDIDYSRQVLAPLLDTTDYGVQIAALYGDAAANALGYAPLGLSPDAGFAVALADALQAAG